MLNCRDNLYKMQKVTKVNRTSTVSPVESQFVDSIAYRSPFNESHLSISSL